MNRIVFVLTVFGGILNCSTLWAADPWETNRFASEPWAASPRLPLQSQLGPAIPRLPSVATAEFESKLLVESELGSQGSALIASTASYPTNLAVSGLLPTTTIHSELAANNSLLMVPLVQLRQIRGSESAVEPTRHMEHMFRMQSDLAPARHEALPTFGQPNVLGVGADKAWLGAYQP